LRKLRRPSHATLVAYLALFVALGGTVYAASKINGKSIKPKSIPGNRLEPNSVTGRQIKESTLNGLNLLATDIDVRDSCAGLPGGTGLCAATTLRLRNPSRVLAMATGGWAQVPPSRLEASNTLTCDIERDGKLGKFSPTSQQYGDRTDNSTSAFAVTSLSKGKVPAGNHRIQLFCTSQTDRVERPTILALAISGG
jgi:hypothetical protein